MRGKVARELRKLGGNTKELKKIWNSVPRNIRDLKGYTNGINAIIHWHRTHQAGAAENVTEEAGSNQ